VCDLSTGTANTSQPVAEMAVGHDDSTRPGCQPGQQNTACLNAVDRATMEGEMTPSKSASFPHPPISSIVGEDCGVVENAIGRHPPVAMAAQRVWFPGRMSADPAQPVLVDKR
jgi:hypothetical protein